VPVYVNYGVADLGFSGSDVVYEGDFEFLHLARLPFGGTRICVAGYEKDRPLFEQNGLERSFIKPIKIATKFTRFTNHYFEERGIPVQIIKLTGSVELAPILGLAHFIVDLVETGSTLRENNLAVIEEIGRTHVKLIANPSLYRQNYRKIDDFVSKLQG
jgi:ATP phosphoribosyltransferase